jgi:hypothetical protein
MSAGRLKHYGWGREGEKMSDDERAFVLGRYREKFARVDFETIDVPRLEDLVLPKPRGGPHLRDRQEGRGELEPNRVCAVAGSLGGRRFWHR